jgi:radical SAM superfamily enzyme
MQQQTLHRMGKESPAYLDTQIEMRTNLQTRSRRQEVVAYFTRATRNYRDKEWLVVPFNTGNHWVTLAISTKYDLVWYCDSLRLIDPTTSD